MGQGLPTQGAQTIFVARGILGYGLKLGGTAKYSGAAASLSTTQLKVTFDTDRWTQDGIARVPRLIRFRMVGQTLAIALGEKTAAETLAADTWSAWLPCTALYENADSWWLTAGAEGVLEYEIAYT